MPARDRLAADETDQSDATASEPPETSVTAHRSSPDRVVFTEADNADAWMSSDTTVDIQR